MLYFFPEIIDTLPETFTPSISYVLNSVTPRDREPYLIDFKDFFFKKVSPASEFPNSLIVDQNELLGGSKINFSWHIVDPENPLENYSSTLTVNQKDAPLCKFNLNKLRQKSKFARAYSLVVSKPCDRILTIDEIGEILISELDIIIAEWEKQGLYPPTGRIQFSEAKTSTLPRGFLLSTEIKDEQINLTWGHLDIVCANITPESCMHPLATNYRTSLFISFVYSLSPPAYLKITFPDLVENLSSKWEILRNDLLDHLTFTDGDVDYSSLGEAEFCEASF